MSELLTNLVGGLFKRTLNRPVSLRPRRAALRVEFLEDRMTPSGGYLYIATDVGVFVMDNHAPEVQRHQGNDVVFAGLGQGGSATIDYNGHGTHVAGTVGSSQDTGITPILKYLASDPSQEAGVTTSNRLISFQASDPATATGATGGGGAGKVAMQDVHYMRTGASIDVSGLTAGATGGHVNDIGGGSGNDIVVGGLDQDGNAASVGTGSPNRLLFRLDQSPAIDDLSMAEAAGNDAGGAATTIADADNDRAASTRFGAVIAQRVLAG